MIIFLGAVVIFCWLMVILEFLKYVKAKFVRADIREHLARMETIKDKLETIINKG